VPELETAESWAVSRWNDALPIRDGQRVTVAALRAVAEMFDPGDAEAQAAAEVEGAARAGRGLTQRRGDAEGEAILTGGHGHE
jgi:hypothetical protein